MNEEVTTDPILTFGLIADVQYADVEDGYDFSKTTRRYYRGALKKLQHAIITWNEKVNPQPTFLLQLGDVLDGKNKTYGSPQAALNSITDEFDRYSGSIYHVWGNHEYYNFTRETLLNSKLYSGNDRFSSPVQGKGYYSARPYQKILIIALDCYEISLIANPVNATNYETARKVLQNNPNSDKNSSEGLMSMDKRFVKYNGGLTQEQLAWLDTVLSTAVEEELNVIVIGHCPIYEGACHVNNLCWNGDEVMKVLHQHSEVVICYIAGHDHSGAYAEDEKGITHITLPAVLENNMESDFGTAYLYSEKIVISGNGRVKDFELKLRNKIPLCEVPIR